MEEKMETRTKEDLIRLLRLSAKSFNKFRREYPEAEINLEGTDLKTKDLNGANFQGANLRNTDLRWTKIEGADFRGADITGANLFEAQLIGANFAGAKGMKRSDFDRWVEETRQTIKLVNDQSVAA
jgi:uncharacterized protein YjbI with pentapeptide repeats